VLCAHRTGAGDLVAHLGQNLRWQKGSNIREKGQRNRRKTGKVTVNHRGALSMPFYGLCGIQTTGPHVAVGLPKPSIAGEFHSTHRLPPTQLSG
jgi:hypothetical protein